MKTVIIVTYIDFWRGGAGHRTRLAAMINFLKNKASITIAYIGPYQNGDDDLIAKNYAWLNLHFLEKNVQLAIESYAHKFSEFIKNKHFDIAILEYIEMYMILDYFPESTITILDTHDILSDKIASFKSSKMNYEGMNISFDQEMRLFSEFDHVMLINKNDYKRVSLEISPDKLLLIPHPSSFTKKEIRENAAVISFVGSDYQPNIEAMKWFLSKVWPYILSKDSYLNIYGHVCRFLKPYTFADNRIRLFNYVENINEVYSISDILVNPVSCGAGLKIKNVEALANGLPLITTTHGASGLEEAYPLSYLKADCAADFINVLNDLIVNYDLRKTISDNSYAYARETFSEEVCFSPLLRFLN